MASHKYPLGHWEMRAVAALATVVTVVGLVWIYAFPPESLRTTRDGVPYFAPEVMHPETGEGVPLTDLIKHYKGE